MTARDHDALPDGLVLTGRELFGLVAMSLLLMAYPLWLALR